MSKRDVLDERMAQRFAWRSVKPGETVDVADLGEAPTLAAALAAPEAKPTEAQLSKAERERWERTTRACADLAKQVARVWEMTPRGRQIAATITLFERVQALGVDLVGMREHPFETVRLFRLAVRHYPKLPAPRRRDGAHALSFAPLSASDPEVVDLLVEVAASGESWLTFLLERSAAREAAGRRYPELGERLAHILDNGVIWAARETAARWLALADLPSAIPSLQRALRLPHARIRSSALHGLLKRTPRALTEDDVLWLLDDAVEHPLPSADGSSRFEALQSYEDALIEAVKTLRPAEGWRPLSVIADGGGAVIRREREGLDAGFALRALAAGYPERALVWLDRALATLRFSLRLDVIEAAALLPEELARPRLLDVAARPDPSSAEHARKLWLERFGTECPSEPLRGVPTELLSAPPSEAFFARLTVLRGSSTDAAGALLAALLAEAPAAASVTMEPRAAPSPGPPAEARSAPAEREALALLLFSLHGFGGDHGHPGLPSGEEAWAKRLIERFGEPALDGLFALAERGALAGVDHGWLSALASLARAGVIAGAYRDRLRDVAARALGSPAWCGATAPLIALVVVGPPPELCERLWSIAMRSLVDEPTDGPSTHAGIWAVDALKEMKDAPALDERILREAEGALRERSFSDLEELVNLGCRRRLPAVFALVERCLAGLDEDPALLEVAATGAYWMKAEGRIDEAWTLAALSRPGSLRFAIATRLCRSWPSLAVLSALQRALSSPARSGSAAAEAAEALLAMDALGPEDARFDGILERAPLLARAALAEMLFLCDAPLAPYRQHVVDLLASVDGEVAENLFEALYMKDSEGTWELFEAVLALGPSPAIQQRIEHYLGEPSEAELYWQDEGDEDEDEDEDEEEEMG